MTPGHLRLAAAALILLAVTTVAACSSSGGGGTTGGTSAGSCAAASPPAFLAWAKVVFDGVMLPGPTVPMGAGDVLTSPARVRVVRYLKGGGPQVVTVVTGVTHAAGGVAVAEDGIQARAGQRWRIYAMTQKMPYETSVCSGSAPLGASS
jgi:hypothetical protein